MNRNTVVDVLAIRFALYGDLRDGRTVQHVFAELKMQVFARPEDAISRRGGSKLHRHMEINGALDHVGDKNSSIAAVGDRAQLVLPIRQPQSTDIPGIEYSIPFEEHALIFALDNGLIEQFLC